MVTRTSFHGVCCTLLSLALATAGGCQTPTTAPPGDLKPPNLLLVSLDTVRWDHTSLAGYARDTTPGLVEFAALEGAITFTHAYSAASWSLPSYGSIFTGLHAISHGAGTRNVGLPEEVTTLAEMLAAYGYTGGGFAGGAHLSHKLGLAQGFDDYQSTTRLSSIGALVPPALEWVDKVQAEDPARPFFLFVQGYDAHSPYFSSPFLMERYDRDYRGPVHRELGLNSVQGMLSIAGNYYWPEHHGAEPPALLGVEQPTPPFYVPYDPETTVHVKLNDADFTHIIAHYDAAVRQADYHLGRLLTGLEARGLLDNTVVVILADHGESLHEEGYFRHEGEAGDRVFHVPLVIRVPQSQPARRWEGVVSLTDLLPTLAAYLGVVPPAECQGQSFVQVLQNTGLAPELDRWRTAASISLNAYVVRTMEWQLFGQLRLDGPPRWTLHHDGEGPDLAASHPEVLERLMPVVEGWPERISADGSVPHVTDPELRRALAEEGYWIKAPKEEE